MENDKENSVCPVDRSIKTFKTRRTLTKEEATKYAGASISYKLVRNSRIQLDKVSRFEPMTSLFLDETVGFTKMWEFIDKNLNVEKISNQIFYKPLKNFFEMNTLAVCVFDAEAMLGCSIVEINSENLHIGFIGVHQGINSNLKREVICMLLEWLASQDHQKSTCRVDHSNKVSLAFFKRLGFCVTSCNIGEFKTDK